MEPTYVVTWTLSIHSFVLVDNFEKDILSNSEFKSGLSDSVLCTHLVLFLFSCQILRNVRWWLKVIMDYDLTPTSVLCVCWCVGVCVEGGGGGGGLGLYSNQAVWHPNGPPSPINHWAIPALSLTWQCTNSGSIVWQPEATTHGLVKQVLCPCCGIPWLQLFIYSLREVREYWLCGIFFLSIEN